MVSGLQGCSHCLVNVLLQCRGVGQKLVVQPGLLHSLLHSVAESQAVDDGQCSGCGDLSAPGGTQHHVDLAVLTHDDLVHGPERLFPWRDEVGWSRGHPGWLMMLGKLKSSNTNT